MYAFSISSYSHWKPSLLKRSQVKLKLWTKGNLTINGKSEAEFIGGGKMNLIFDARGRTVEPFMEGQKQLAIMKVIYERPKEEIEDNA
jgi:hypothetical protein